LSSSCCSISSANIGNKTHQQQKHQQEQQQAAPQQQEATAARTTNNKNTSKSSSKQLHSSKKRQQQEPPTTKTPARAAANSSTAARSDSSKNHQQQKHQQEQQQTAPQQQEAIAARTTNNKNTSKSSSKQIFCNGQFNFPHIFQFLISHSEAFVRLFAAAFSSILFPILLLFFCTFLIQEMLFRLHFVFCHTVEAHLQDRFYLLSTYYDFYFFLSLHLFQVISYFYRMNRLHF
jgi:DNA mismatch repair ATPase MutL